MAHDGDAAFHDAPHLFRHRHPALQLDGLGAALLDKAGGVIEGVFQADVVGHEGHIADDHRLFGAADHRLGVVEHLLHGYRYGGFVAEDDHAQAIAHQN